MGLGLLICDEVDSEAMRVISVVAAISVLGSMLRDAGGQRRRLTNRIDGALHSRE